MGPEGVFVQFTYGLRSPIPRDAFASRYVGALRRAGAAQPAAGERLDFSRRGRGAVAPAPKIAKLIDQAERFGAQLVERGKATEAMLSRQGDRVKEMLEARRQIRETAPMKPRERLIVALDAPTRKRRARSSTASATPSVSTRSAWS